MPIRAKKSLGQNFLINPHILDKIVSAAEVSKDDIVLEVGPGTGLLTKKLAEKAGKVIAIEKDRRLIEPLKETFSAKGKSALGGKNYPNVEIIEGDILDTRMTLVIQGSSLYKIVANIPYYTTSNFLRKVFEDWPQPKLIVLTVQKEVAQRIVAKPPHMNLLALSVQYYSKPEIIGYISKNNFRPVPKVDSAIIRLRPKSPEVELPMEVQLPYPQRSLEVESQRFPEVRPRKNQKLFELIRIGFSEKRKQLAPVLAKKLKIDKHKIIEVLKNIGVPPTARAENLSLEQWLLFKSYLFK